MSRILVTGGAGFIGYHLAKNLLANDYKVDLLDNFSRGVMDDELQMLSNEENIKMINLQQLTIADLRSFFGHRKKCTWRARTWTEILKIWMDFRS